YSLYASEVGLGNVNFDIAELVAPLPDSAEPEPRPQAQRPSLDHNNQANQHSTMASTDEPTMAPPPFSVVRNSGKARDWRPTNFSLPESTGPVWSICEDK